MRLDPERARKTIMAAYRESQANLRATAELLDCSVRSVIDWIARLGLRKVIDATLAEAKRDGWMHDGFTHGGRPMGAKDKQLRVNAAKKKPVKKVAAKKTTKKAA